MASVYVSVGSNINREHNLRGGIAALREHYGPIRLSTVYESASVGFAGDNFYNLVLSFGSDESIAQICQRLREIEERFGRVRGGAKFSSRTLDLDLLLYDDVIQHGDGVDIPREEITRNAFVLLPLAELAPELMHPELHQTYHALWQAYDQASQSLWGIDFNWH